MNENDSQEEIIKTLEEENKLLRDIVKIQKEMIDRMVTKFILHEDLK